MFCSYRRFVYNFSYGIGSIRKNVDPWTQNPSDSLPQWSNSFWNIFRLVTALLAAGLCRFRNIANFIYEYVNDIIALNLSDIKICVLSAKFFRDLVPLLCVVCINTNL